ncbi:hypothetical protein GCM10023200_12710 [Actinomycetospora chlora]|uniref:Uncharacterized protein n=1 Tax=Actinomycetospora chlora TaxID=663608 RepID=A0ABP9AHQ5_9PSEU
MRTASVERLLAMALVATVAVTIALSLVTALLHPAPAALWAYVDGLEPYNFPTWAGAVVLLLAALACLAAGLAARAARRRDAVWWAAAAVGPTIASLCVATGFHTRIDGLARQVVGTNPLTTDWLPSAIAAGLLFAVPFVVVSRRLPHGRWLLAAVAAVGVGALVSELLVRALGPGGRVPAELAEGVQILGAVGLLLALVGAVTVVRDGTELGILPAGASPDDLAGPRRGGLHASPDLRRRLLWALLLVPTVALSALSLLVTLAFPTPGPKLEQWIGYLNVDAEGNLPTWWAVGLLAIAAVAHLLAGLAGRATGARAAVGWLVTAAILAGMSLDDMTSIHERVGDMVKPEGAGGTDGSFSFYWVIPGAGVALAIAVVVGALARQLRGRPRWLLVGGLGVLFFFALGLEGIEGAVIASQQGSRVVQVLAYHVEELGENVGALLLIGAATSALTVRRRAGALGVRYVGAGEPVEEDGPEPAPVDPAALPTEAIPVAATTPIARG